MTTLQCMQTWRMRRKMKINNLIKKLNEENAPPDGWKDEDKVQLECRAKKCSSTLRPDWTSKLDPRYCLDCMPW